MRVTAGNLSKYNEEGLVQADFDAGMGRATRTLAVAWLVALKITHGRIHDEAHSHNHCSGRRRASRIQRFGSNK